MSNRDYDAYQGLRETAAAENLDRLRRDAVRGARRPAPRARNNLVLMLATLIACVSWALVIAQVQL